MRRSTIDGDGIEEEVGWVREGAASKALYHSIANDTNLLAVSSPSHPFHL